MMLAGLERFFVCFLGDIEQLESVYRTRLRPWYIGEQSGQNFTIHKGGKGTIGR
jgi:hypothetical protein